MTREEAIKILEVAKAEVEWNCPLDYQVALDMAIEALQQPDMPLLQAIKTIKDFLEVCDDHSTSTVMIAPDGTKMNADWGYFEDGLEVIKHYAEGRIDDD